MSWKFENIIPPIGTITEGPALEGDRLLFSNITMNRVLALCLKSGRLELFASDTEGTNGLNFDSKGRLYGCAGAGRRIIQFDENGRKTTVVDRLNGRRLNGPNDLAITPDGSVYFSDRIENIHSDMGIPYSAILSAEPRPSESFECVRRTSDSSMPNGLLFSKDYKTLYVAQSDYRASERRELRAYPVEKDGSLGTYEVVHDFGPHRGIDGMTLAADGLIVACTGWEVSGPGGCITIFEPDGRIVETHPLPASRPTNCAFVGKVLYVTSIEGHLMAAETELEGCPLWPNNSAT